jgi:hypothetical protein
VAEGGDAAGWVRRGKVREDLCAVPAMAAGAHVGRGEGEGGVSLGGHFTCQPVGIFKPNSSAFCILSISFVRM